MARPMSIQGKVRECARVVLYWAKRPGEPTAAYNMECFHKALIGHLAYVEENGVCMPAETMAMASRASEARFNFGAVKA